MAKKQNTATPAGGVASAQELMRMISEREAAKAAEAMRKLKEEERKKKDLLDSFHAPSHLSPDQLMAKAMGLFRDAAERGQTEVLAYRFPNSLCTDRGRAINNGEAGWEETLTGRPKFVHEFWRDHLRPLGYKMKAEVVEFPGGMPGDIGFILSWKA
jgi:hypothetical protein